MLKIRLDLSELSYHGINHADSGKGISGERRISKTKFQVNRCF